MIHRSRKCFPPARSGSSGRAIGAPALGLRLLLAIAALAAGAAAVAADLQPVPPFGARVTDLTDTLTPEQTQTLSAELEALEQRKGSRVAVLIVPTTAPEEIEQYSIRVTDSWKLSRSDKRTQDGVLLLVAKNDHRVRIEVGRDLEGAITDVASAQIIRETITPKFRSGDFYGGIHDALDALTRLIDGETLPPPGGDDGKHGNDPIGGLGLGIFFLIWARGFFSWLPSAPRAVLVGAATGAAVWIFGGALAMAIGLGLLGALIGWLGGSGASFINRGGWGSGSLGSGGWSGGGGGWSGGGGFSGGSSGGFSGGGASGSW